MARFLAALLAVLVLAAPFPVHAQYTPLGKDPAQTDNPNHKGYGYDKEFDEYYPVEWKPIRAFCDPCQTLAEAYNTTVHQLLYTRYWIAFINDQKNERDDIAKRMRAMGRMKNAAPGEGMSEIDQRIASAEINYHEGVDALVGKLPALEAQEDSLEALSDDLRAQLQSCEDMQCKGQDYKKAASLEGGGKASGTLPFDWKGPYPGVCHKCEKLANRLNELPDFARFAIAGLEGARARLMSAETEIAIIQVQHDGMVFTYEGDSRTPEEIMAAHKKDEKRVKKDLEQMEKMKQEAERDITKYESDLDKIQQNFSETLALYDDCVRTCQPAQTGMADPEKPKTEQVTGAGVQFSPDKCFAKVNYSGFTVGANSAYGTGAQMKEKARDMAAGAAMGALNNVIGGSGISLGAGKGGGMQQIDGPRLDKNPLKGDEQPFKWEGFYIGVNGGFTDKGFVLNQKIEDSPDGNSTFHATWLQDQQGRTILPSSYYIYDIYRDHKLTVWWTYDHWTNGVHDYHDEGSETTQWREDLGSFKTRFGGDKGVENSIWYQSGFDTAVKGVRHMGAVYAGIGPEDLTGCGLNAVTHLTLPSYDPVITTPFVLNLRTDAEKAADEKAFLRSLQMTMPPF